MSSSSIRDLTGKHVQQPTTSTLEAGLWFARKLEPAKLSKYLTVKTCAKNRSPESRHKIDAFAKQYAIDPKTVLRCADVKQPDECWRRFASLNDFFTRERVGLPPVRPRAHRELVSPADAYTVYLRPQTIAQKLWVKGRHFTVRGLFGATADAWLERYHLLIFRLAPHHYHRYHAPVAGRVHALKVLGTEYFSVDPKLVTSAIDVYTRNVRVLVKLETLHGEWVYLAIVGATCVGSIQLTHPKVVAAFGGGPLTDRTLRERVGSRAFEFPDPPTVRVNEELGNFQFGGSTVVLIAPETYEPTAALRKIQAHTESAQPFETELKVGTVLFRHA